MSAAEADRRDEALLRRGVALVWLATGLFVVHPYYRRVGADHLQPLGMPDALMWLTCAAEVVLAAVLFRRPTDRLQAIAQTAPVVAFTVILGVESPTLLVHPFGVLSKNLPLVGAIWSAEAIGRRGYDEGAARLLRVSMGIVWLTEGLFPKLLFPSPLEIDVTTHLGVSNDVALVMIRAAGLGQIVCGLGVLFLRGKPRRLLLKALLSALIALPLLVTYSHPEMWVHPFGPLTKNFPILAGTWVLLRRTTS